MLKNWFLSPRFRARRRCFPLLPALWLPSRVAFGPVAVASRCFPLCGFRFRLRRRCFPLLVLKFIGAARGLFFPIL